MDSIESLTQLEIDLASPEMAKLSSRLTGLGHLKSHAMSQLGDEVQEKSNGKFKCKELADKLLKARSVRGPGAESKELEEVPWPLRVRSMHHWSSKTLKNAKRDVPKHAIVACMEVLTVSDYRPKLLRESAAARYLRTILRKILNSGLKKIKGATQPRGQGRIKWTYHDGLSWEDKSFTPGSSDARKLLLDHSRLVEGKERGQEVVGLLNRVLKHKAALIKSGDQAYADVVAPEVSTCVRNLLNVSGRSCLIRDALIHII